MATRYRRERIAKPIPPRVQTAPLPAERIYYGEYLWSQRTWCEGAMCVGLGGFPAWWVWGEWRTQPVTDLIRGKNLTDADAVAALWYWQYEPSTRVRKWTDPDRTQEIYAHLVTALRSLPRDTRVPILTSVELAVAATYHYDPTEHRIVTPTMTFDDWTERMDAIAKATGGTDGT